MSMSPLVNDGRVEHMMGPERETLCLTFHPQCTGAYTELLWQTFRPWTLLKLAGVLKSRRK